MSPTGLAGSSTGLRSQYGHITDIAPTIYEAAGVTMPESFAGVEQLPLDGTSLLYSFADPQAPSRHTTQYYEMLGNVGIYQDGWLANLGPPNVIFAPQYGREKHWELYDLDTDFAQAQDVAALYPERLARLQALWEQQQAANGFSFAARGNVGEGLLQSQREAFAGPRRLTYRRGEGPFLDGAFPSLPGRSWRLSVPVTVSEGAQGTIISQGGFPFGWGLYLIDGRPSYVHVNEPEAPLLLQGPALVAGQHDIVLDVAPVGDPVPGGPTRFRLLVDGELVVETQLERTVRAHWGGNGVGIGREVGMVMLPETGS